MATKSDFDNYLSDYISTAELRALLDVFKHKEPGDPHLVCSVNDSGDGLISGKATAWMQVSTSRSEMLARMLQDDDGKSELDRYEMTLSGLADCLDGLSGNQDEFTLDEFYAEVKKLIR